RRRYYAGAATYTCTAYGSKRSRRKTRFAGFSVRPSPRTETARPARPSTRSGTLTGVAPPLTATTYNAPFSVRALATTGPFHGTTTGSTSVQSAGASERSRDTVDASWSSTPGSKSHRFQRSPVQLFVKRPSPHAPPATASHASAFTIDGVIAIVAHSPVMRLVSIHWKVGFPGA